MENEKIYYSQEGQDAFLNETIFKNKKNGFFVDIGANDGLTYSNSYFFEKILDWDGICVEPIPSSFDKLKKSRSCHCYNIAISNTEKKELEFVSITGYSEMLSGLKDNYNIAHLARIDQELIEHGGNKEVITVKVRKLKELIEEHKINHIDFCSIDTEGSELLVLQSIDFSKVKIDYFVIENNYGSKKISAFLKKKGYKKIASLKMDEVYKFTPNIFQKIKNKIFAIARI